MTEAACASAFELTKGPILTGTGVDRSEHLRGDPELLRQLWSSGRVLVVDHGGRSEMDTAGDVWRLMPTNTTALGALSDSATVFLGVCEGTGYWAVRSESDGRDLGWQDLRAAGAMLDPASAGLFATAVGLLAWHDVARYCGVCGATTHSVHRGWARHCGGCAREEYPRTDPAVICLVHDGADHVLLARQPNWPQERFSVLAGFVEVGESLEECVEREIHEEVGVSVHSVRYLGSQPWPFPRSLMVGFAAVADPDQTLRLAEGEIAQARWWHRDDVLAAFDAGDSIPGLRLPGGISIANRMLASWASAR